MSSLLNSQLMIDALHWKYFAEGNMQLVFQYKNDNNININESSNQYLNKVLKISKKTTTSALELEYQNTFRHWIRNWFNNKYIHPYFEFVSINKSIVESLLATYSIEMFRVNTTMLLLEKESFIAVIEHNLMNCFHNQKQSTLSFEIKMKSGLASCSPFISRNKANCVKYYVGRHQLMWKYKYHTHSNYNPCDLASTSYDEVSRGIRHLFNEKKHIRCRFSDQLYNGTYSDEEFMNFLFDFFQQQININILHEMQRSHDFIQQIITKVLFDESCSNDIQYLQQLDLLDVEGIHLIIQRLISLLSCDFNKLKSIIQLEFCKDDNMIIKNLEFLKQLSFAIHNIRQNIPTALDFPKEFGFLKDLFSTCSKIIQSNGIVSPTDEEIFSMDMTLWMNSLSIDNCIALVHMWLIPLMARDCSMILSFQVVDIKLLSDLDSCDDFECRIIKHYKDQANPGEMEIKLKCLSIDTFYLIQLKYHIGLTDIGPKDLQKLLDKVECEDEICKVFVLP